MADAMENKFDVIIFHKIDRNSHNELNYFIFKDKLETLGIRYEYAAQPIDAETAEGQMMETEWSAWQHTIPVILQRRLKKA
mgnify:CR=1 FL=1